MNIGAVVVVPLPSCNCDGATGGRPLLRKELVPKATRASSFSASGRSFGVSTNEVPGAVPCGQAEKCPARTAAGQVGVGRARKQVVESGWMQQFHKILTIHLFGKLQI